MLIAVWINCYGQCACVSSDQIEILIAINFQFEELFWKTNRNKCVYVCLLLEVGVFTLLHTSCAHPHTSTTIQTMTHHLIFSFSFESFAISVWWGWAFVRFFGGFIRYIYIRGTILFCCVSLGNLLYFLFCSWV